MWGTLWGTLWGTCFKKTKENETPMIQELSKIRKNN